MELTHQRPPVQHFVAQRRGPLVPQVLDAGLAYALKIHELLRAGGTESASADRVEADNPWISVTDEVKLGPDGDVLPESSDGFLVPECSVCGGMLKPDVVFFGEFIPAEKFREAEQLVRTSEALLIVRRSSSPAASPCGRRP